MFNKSILIAICIGLSLIFSSINNAGSQESQDDIEKELDIVLAEHWKAVFKNARCIGSFVYLDGTAKHLGLSERQLGDFMRLRIRNDLSTMPSCKKYGNGTIIVKARVWTVGEGPLFAMHLRLDAGPLTDQDAYSQEILGCSTQQLLEESVKKGIGDLVEEFSIFLLKVKGQF